MVGVNNWRPIETMDDWLRQIEKRMMHEERRPIPLPTHEVVGPGIKTYSQAVEDWDSDGPIVNGFFYSDADQVINSPDDTRNWMGITQANANGEGLQRVWEYIVTETEPNPDPAIYTRAFVTNEDGTRTYTDWLVGGGGSGSGSPTGPAGGDLDGTYPNPQIRAGVITDADVNAANKDGANGVPSMRTLGTTAGQALPGNIPLDDITPPDGPVNMNNQRVAGVGTPTAGTDAVNKTYVDAAAAAAPVWFRAALGALGAGTWHALSHNLNRTPVSCDFFEVSTSSAIVLDYRVVSANAVEVRSDLAVAAGVYSILVMG